MEQKGCGPTSTCSHCEARKRKEAENEEMGLAILLALMPLMVMTLFGQIGLF